MTHIDKSGREIDLSYIELVEHYENCFRAYGDNNRGVDWPNPEDAELRYQIMLDIIRFDQMRKTGDNSRPSILDFGCGLGHLYEYILKHDLNVEYAGLDLSQLFVDECKKKYPDREFVCMDLLKKDLVVPQNYDYIVLNGVFTEKRELFYEEMLSYFKELVIKVYAMCNKGIAFNVMSKDVDWERDDLFHLPLNTLSSFLVKELTRDFIIRNDYGLYEYTVYLYKRSK